MKFDARMLLVAVFCFGVGFMVADRIGTATAAPMQATPQDPASFSGTNGTVAVGGHLFIVRDNKVYKIPTTMSGETVKGRAWALLE